jgi:hypothetical protein
MFSSQWLVDHIQNWHLSSLVHLKYWRKLALLQYRLVLPDHSLIHLVFHVSQLKPFTPNYSPIYSEWPKLVDLSSHDLQPERILDRRLVKKGNQAIQQVFVSPVPKVSTTWEDLYVVRERFPGVVAW